MLAGLESFNDAAQIEPVYAELFAWRDVHGYTVILSHHPRKRGRWETGVPTLDMVRDSSTNVGKASAVWFAQKPARGACCLDVHTLKHRDRDPVPIQRLGYVSEGNDGAIRLRLEERETEVEGEIERAQTLVDDFIRQRDAVRTREIVSFAHSQGVREKTAKRALRALVDLNLLEQPLRGWYKAVPRVSGVAEAA